MQYSSDLLLLVVLTFLGSFAVAVSGAERKRRAAIEIWGLIMAGLALRFGIALVLGQGSVERVPISVFVMIIGIGACVARFGVNQMTRMRDMSAE